ncbi:cell wall hydrolase [Weissella oryzae SG25]|uniref:Cell wall hydrolase n=1 Tax=Weissella oryzae (strain DSM 25784 / JCM 18191 / LMG 30913 / SG25) TaxID=1329250 RepID=A0A069CVD3_WEIOS|nr:LysM domain-containing protein [Weissella oryzae]GAK31745.1 cell wall hydrolase [Weissella oryzae SG25]
MNKDTFLAKNTNKGLVAATVMAAAAAIPMMQTTDASADSTSTWQANTVSQVQQTLANAGGTYTINSGDTVSVIAQATGMTVAQIAQLNGLNNADLIIAGAGLNLTANQNTVAAPTAVSEAPEVVASSEATAADIAASEAASEAAAQSAAIAQSEAVAASIAASEAAVSSAAAASEAAASIAASQAAAASVDAAAQSSAPAQNAPTYQVNTATTADTNTTVAAPSTNTTTSANSGYNSYPAGQCTYYVKSALSWVGNNWGNASAWGASAQAAGHSVSWTPAAGTVAVFAPGLDGASGYGHVAVVDSVNSDGSITISEMNYAGNSGVSNRVIANPSGIQFIYQ